MPPQPKGKNRPVDAKAFQGVISCFANIVVRSSRQQHGMQQEQAVPYDLNALHVDVTTASNSETGLE